MSMEFCKRDYERRFSDDDSPSIVAPIGATEDEIRAVEQRMGLTFPETYREFLLWMGHDAEGILRDGYWFLKDIERLTKNLAPWLQSNGIAPPQGKYVCCYCHQGYVYGWFLVPSDSEDPVMYLYNECDKSHPKPYFVGSFSDWVEEIMSGSTLDIWRQFDARQRYEAGLAAKNGGLNPDGTVFKTKLPPWLKRADALRRKIHGLPSAEEEEAQAQAAQSSPAQPT